MYPEPHFLLCQIYGNKIQMLVLTKLEIHFDRFELPIQMLVLINPKVSLEMLT